MSQSLLLHSFPQAIVHVDGDAFFASCEQAIHPEYRGKPVVTGKERGIAASFSYEAKRRGVVRGMRLFEVRKVCPDCVIVPSDYETYSLISKRMFEIMREFSPVVEEYSIDEGFADITGLRRPLNMSYGTIAQSMKDKIESELGISVSVGVSLNKVLAKLASGFRKPGGCVVVPGRSVSELLAAIPVGEVWGIGPNTASYLGKWGIKTALDFATKNEEWVKKHLTKPGYEIWQELRGKYIYTVDPNAKETYKSISKVKTFTPPTKNAEFVYGQLIRNLEKACIKARRYNLVAKRVSIVLRHQDFSHSGYELRLSRASAYPTEIAPYVRPLFERIFRKDTLYRMTGVVLHDLESAGDSQRSLFDDPVRVAKIEKLFRLLDQMAQKYGKHTLHTASSIVVDAFEQHVGARGDAPERRKRTVFGERGRKRLRLPYFFAEV